jgi:hypothetical protein
MKEVTRYDSTIDREYGHSVMSPKEGGNYVQYNDYEDIRDRMNRMLEKPWLFEVEDGKLKQELVEHEKITKIIEEYKETKEYELAAYKDILSEIERIINKEDSNTAINIIKLIFERLHED